MMTPSQDILFADWWISNRKRVHKESRKGFERKSLQVVQLLQLISDEGRQWILAGYSSLPDFFT
jgi:hypothetical protein